MKIAFRQLCVPQSGACFVLRGYLCAQAVYDALVAEGVKESQLEKVAMGGTDNMFGKNYLNRVVILEVK